MNIIPVLGIFIRVIPTVYSVYLFTAGNKYAPYVSYLSNAVWITYGAQQKDVSILALQIALAVATTIGLYRKKKRLLASKAPLCL